MVALAERLMHRTGPGGRKRMKTRMDVSLAVVSAAPASGPRYGGLA